MIRKLLCGTISAVLLGQASVGFAYETAHTSVLKNLSAPRNVKLIVHTTSTEGGAGLMHAFTGCWKDGYVFVLGKGFPEGIFSATYFIENSSGSYEAIKSYDLLLKGGDSVAEPDVVEIDMSAYTDYPTCTNDVSTDSVIQLHPTK